LIEANEGILKQLLFIIGLPGSGKNTAGEILSENHGYTFYDLDDFWVPKVKVRLQENRLAFNSDEIEKMTKESFEIIDDLIITTDRLVVTYFMRENVMRELYLSRYPIAKIIWLVVAKEECVRRVRERKSHSLNTDDILKAMDIFEPLSVPHVVLKNDGSISSLKKKLAILLNETLL
jgi:gluconokinase